MKAYFKEALEELRATSPAVQTDFFEVDARKFVAKVYLEGDLKAQCKIWLGGPFRGVQISYSTDATDVGRENSCNEWLSLHSDDDLVWVAGMPMFGGEPGPFDNVGAAAYLWRRFVEGLQ